MGILSKIKDKIYGIRGDEDLEDIRSTALGDQYQDKFNDLYPGQQSSGKTQPPGSFEQPAPLPEKSLGDLPPTDRRDLTLEPPLEQTETEKDYEIRDRLQIIESQLQAIRSQTETINERLKNMEMRLGRRY